MKAAEEDDYALALRLQNEEDANARNGNVMWRSASNSNRVATSDYEQGWEHNPNTEYVYSSPNSISAINVDTTSPRYDASGHVIIHEDPTSADTRYAYFLQMMEFEIQDDLQENRQESRNSEFQLEKTIINTFYGSLCNTNCFSYCDGVSGKNEHTPFLE